MQKDSLSNHHKFYKNMSCNQRDLEIKMDDLATGEYGETSPAMGRKIKQRVRMGDRMPVPLMTLEDDSQ